MCSQKKFNNSLLLIMIYLEDVYLEKLTRLAYRIPA